MHTERAGEHVGDWRAIDLAGKSALEASAGTGKTYNLVLLVLRLLLERELPPSAILLATFTEAATLELRARVAERVRQAYFAALHPNDPKRIASAESTLSASDPLAQYLSARWQVDIESATDLGAANKQTKRTKSGVRIRDEKILERAMLQMDDMPIRTLHGLCRQLLSSFDLVPGDSDAEIEDGAALTNAALEDAFRRRFTDVTVLPEALLDALDTGFLNAITDGVNRVLNYGRIRLRPAARVNAKHYRDARSALFEPSFRAQLLEASLDAKGEFKLRAETKRCIENLLRSLQSGITRQMPKASLAPFLNPEAAQKQSPRYLMHENPALAQLCQFAQLHQLAMRGEFAFLLNSLVTEVRASRSITLAARGGVSFDSMIEQLAERLDPSHASQDANFDNRAAVQLANAIHQRYPVALIDEFQDTDAQQWAILQAIYGARGGLILVGDPKQSIYRFRGSDVHTFVRATKSCTPYFLQHNYRSSAPLVAAVNGFYDAAARPFHSADIVFRDAQVGRLASAAPAELAVDRGWSTQKPLCFIEVVSSDKLSVSSDPCIRTAVSDIKNLLQTNSDKTPPSIALLLTSNREVQHAQNYLRELGVHASASASLGVFKSAAAQVLQCVLCALAAPADLARARAARLALKLETLDRVSELDERALFAWADHSLSQLLARGIAAVCLRLIVEPVCTDSQFVRDTTHLAELLAAEEQALLDANPALRENSTDYAQAIWQTLNTHIDKPDGQNDGSDRRRIAPGAQVQVMTIHKSKGLEFDVVFLPTLFSAWNFDAQVAIIPGTDGLECDAGSADFENAIQLEKDEVLAERLRHQYVALTRAKESVNVYFHSEGVKDASALGWHLANVAAKPRPVQMAEVAGEPDIESDVESDWADQINAVPAPIEPAPIAWRAGLERLVKHENIAYTTRELSAFELLAVTQIATEAPNPTPQRHDPLPALRPPQRRISFSSMTQSEGRIDAVAVSQGDTLEPNLDLAAELFSAVSDFAPVELVQGELMPDDAHPEIIALEKLRGPNFGLALHALFEDALSAAEIDVDLVAKRLSQFGFVTDVDSTHAILALVQRNCSVALLPKLNIAGLSVKNCIAELAFQLPVRGLDYRALAELGPRFGLPPLFQPEHALDRVNGMLIGFIDLVFQSEGKYYLLDYKSNWLGASLQDYCGAGLDAAMAQHHYHLQHLLYALALHRYLRQSLPDYDFDTHFGGAHYLFVRAFGLESLELSGAGQYQYRAPKALIDALDALFLGVS